MLIYIITLFILIVCGGLIAITSKNSILSVLFLIFIYILSALCFLLLGAEFIALLVLLVYIGAISILFLFIIMMLNLRVVEVSHRYINYIPIGIFVGVFFLAVILYLFSYDLDFNNLYWYIISSGDNDLHLKNYVPKSNLKVIGEVFFNHYFYFLWIAGLILLLVMVGTIVLTFDFKYRDKDASRKKSIYLYNKDAKDRIKFWGLK